MSRENHSPSAGSTIVDKLKPYEGGTGQITAASALAAMNAVPLDSVGQPGGVAGLGPDKKLPASVLPTNSMSVVSVSGPANVAKSATVTYQITNYDAFTTYSVAAISGIVSINGDTITFVAPSVTGASGFTINGRSFAVAIVDPKPATPVLSAVDVAGTTTSIAALSCTGSAYSAGFGGGTHLNTDWQVATDAAFANIAVQSQADATNKVTWKSGNLSLSTTYYARVRYNDSVGNISEWSNVVQVTTKATYAIGVEEAKMVPTGTVGLPVGLSTTTNADCSIVAVGAMTAGTTGAVYVYTRTGTSWSQTAVIVPSDTTASQSSEFGTSIKMTKDGSRMVIGAPRKSAYVGAFYVFVRSGNNWTQEQFVNGQDTGGLPQFGFAVSISDDGARIAVGAPFSTAAGSGADGGVAFVYSRSGTTWSLEKDLAPTTARVAGDTFGHKLALSGDGLRVVVVSLTDSNNSSIQGSSFATVFVRSGTTWTQESKIDPGGGTYTGWAVSMNLDGTRIAFGAIYYTGTVAQQGAIRIYTRSGSSWAQEAVLIASDPKGFSYFGAAVDITDDGARVISGAWAANKASVVTGAVYVYNRNGVSWTLESKITPSDGAANDQFGRSVAFARDGTRIAVGSYQSKVSSTTTGSSYVYR